MEPSPLRMLLVVELVVQHREMEGEERLVVRSPNIYQFRLKYNQGLHSDKAFSTCLRAILV